MSDDRRAIATLLLVVQAGLALLAALGLLVFARVSNAGASLAGPEALAIGGPLVLLLCAVGVARNWRAARLGSYIWEGFTLLGTAFSVLASAGSSLNLTIAMTGIALPLAIVVLVRSARPIAANVNPDHQSEATSFVPATPPISAPIPSALRTGLTAGLLMLTGVIHLALVPDHLAAPPRLGPLFALDGAAFVILALASLKYRWWRWPAAMLLVLTILAYLVVVARGVESVDDLGLATKLVELVAIGLVVWPRGARLNWRLALPTAGVLLAIGLSGAVTWAASMRPGPAGHTHDGQVVLAAAPPTDAQRLAAAQLLEDTRSGIERFADVQVALADGYRPGTPAMGPTVHYANPAYQTGHVLDPEHPQALVYANTPSGPMLLGAMYMLPKANTVPPDVGGSLTEWHTHSNLCFLVPGFAIDGLESPFGTCPVGSINGPTPPMLHVWTVANPGGPFGDLNPAFEARLTRGGA
jgi:hypothetical protein